MQAPRPLAFRMYFLPYYFMVLLPLLSSAQIQNNNFNSLTQLLTDVTGKPVHLRVAYNLEGSPLYPADYTRADIFVKSGKKYPDILSKFNFLENTLLVKLDDGNELVITTPVPRIVFTDTGVNGKMLGAVFENGFPPIDNHPSNHYYEVIDSGRIKLLKYISVTYMDRKDYGQASITRVYEQKEAFYLFLPDNTIHKLSKGKDALLSLLPDKKSEISSYIDQNSNKCRKEEEWSAVIAYYNSLPAN